MDFIQEHRREAEGVILNPGAFTHTSRALPDCLKALPCPTIEVHISNIHAREAWRHESFVAQAAKARNTSAWAWQATGMRRSTCASSLRREPARGRPRETYLRLTRPGRRGAARAARRRHPERRG